MTDEDQRPKETRIELLYFDGCPTYPQAEFNLKEALAAERLRARVSLVAVDTDEDARRLRFPGSPTIRVDGEDLFPGEAPGRDDWALGCRIYPTPEGPRGAPTPGMLRSALRDVVGAALGPAGDPRKGGEA